MTSTLIQRSMPAMLAAPPAAQHCVRDRYCQPDRTPSATPTSFIDADGVAGSGLGGMLTTAIAHNGGLARLESP